MKVFVIGATGWIGNAITDALLLSQHEVTGLVRSEAAKTALGEKGATAIQGDLTASHQISLAAQQADAVVVASSASFNTTLAALDTLTNALRGTHKPLVYISGSSLYGNISDKVQVSENIFEQRLITSDMLRSPENIVYNSAQQDIHGIVVVGAGILYGRQGGATPTFWLNDASQRNEAWYIGKGDQRWSAVHVDDLARLVVKTLEQRPNQRIFNAVSEALSLKEVAEMIAQIAKVTGGVKSVTKEIATAEWGSFWGEALSGNLWLSSSQAEHVLGWMPVSPSFKDDLLHGSYQQ